MASPGFAETKAKGRIISSISVAIGVDPVQHQRLDVKVGHLHDATVTELVCNCADYKKVKPGRAPWCDHLTIAYTKGRDIIPDEELPERIAVTLFSYPKLVAWVELGPPSVPFDYRTVTPLSMRSGDPFGDVIGMLTPNCGRQVIRHYVMDFLLAADWLHAACKSDWHVDASLPWETAERSANGFDTNSRTHLASLADILWTGHCRACNEDDGVPDV